MIRNTIRLAVALCIVTTLVLPAAGCAQAEGTRYRRHLSVITPPATAEMLAHWPQAELEVVTMVEE